MFLYSLSPMMSHFPSTGPNRKDDGFRISDATIERAVTSVLSTARPRRIPALRRAMAVAASVALILLLGGAYDEFLKTKSCVSFACQLDGLSDEELAGMIWLMEEDAWWEEDALITPY